MAKTSLREQQHELTRNLVLRALVELIHEEGVHAFTMGRVAERAGISERTLYRHFPTRQALLDDLGQWGTEELAQRGVRLPESLEGFPEHARQLARVWEDDEDAVHALAVLRVAGGLQPRERTERVRQVQEAIDTSVPGAPEQHRRWGATVVRALVSSVTWTQIRADSGPAGAEAGDAIAYAVELVVADLRRRHDEAETAARGPSEVTARDAGRGTR